MRQTIPESVHRCRQRGLTLVELMVALTVGLILVGAVIAVFIANNGLYSTNKAVAQIQENGRFALSFLDDDIRMAGYMGCSSDAHTYNILNNSGNSYIYDFNQGLTGYEATGTETGSLTLPEYSLTPTPAAATTGQFNTNPDPQAPPLSSTGVPFSIAGVGEPLPGNDMLIVRYANSLPLIVTAWPSIPSANFKVANLPSYIQAGQIAVITDCTKATVFQITNVQTGNAIVHNSGNVVSPGNSVGSIIPGYQVGAQMEVPDAMVYYIGLGTNGQPALFKADLNTINAPGVLTLQPEELVPDVENMQILYGVDTNNTATASTYVTADQVANWQNVVSVSIAMLMESSPGEVPIPPTAQSFDMLGLTVTAPPDTRLRRLFTTTIGLRNRLP